MTKQKAKKTAFVLFLAALLLMGGTAFGRTYYQTFWLYDNTPFNIPTVVGDQMTMTGSFTQYTKTGVLYGRQTVTADGTAQTTKSASVYAYDGTTVKGFKTAGPTLTEDISVTYDKGMPDLSPYDRMTFSTGSSGSPADSLTAVYSN